MICGFVLSTGDMIGSMKKRASTQQLKIGSVYTNGDTVAWISSYSSSTSYSELIQFNFTSSAYTIYQQTGISFRSQYINPLQGNRWYAIPQTQNISVALLTKMEELNDLSVSELSSTGLDDFASTISTSTSGSVTPTPGSVTPSTSTTNAAADFNVTITVVNHTTDTTSNSTSNSTSNTNQTTTGNNTNNDSDDSVSTLAIVFIAV